LPVRLDGLPFPSSQFDFVRIAYIGLGVPEDEVCGTLPSLLFFFTPDLSRVVYLVAVCIRGTYVTDRIWKTTSDMESLFI